MSLRPLFRCSTKRAVQRRACFAPDCVQRTFANYSARLTENKPSISDSDNSSNGRSRTKAPFTLRPFTLLLFCIPVGWGLRWYTTDSNSRHQRSPDGFVHYTLVSRTPVSSTSSIFTLQPCDPRSALDPAPARSLVSVQLKQPQLQIARAYTVLPPRVSPDPAAGDHPEADPQHSGDLRLLIRRESRGEVSGYLHRLPLGATLEVRGPGIEAVLPERVERVVFLAGGTGIAPALQVARLLGREADVCVLWANRRREECVGGVGDGLARSRGQSWFGALRGWVGWGSSAASTTEAPAALLVSDPSDGERASIVAELDDIRRATPSESGRGLRLDYFVDEEGSFIRPRDVSALISQPTEMDNDGRKLLFVSGPEGFISHWAGPKAWAQGREVQGPLGGVLATMDLRGWDVVKL